MNKKIKKAIMAAGAAYAGSKMLGAREKGLLAATEDGKSASSMITGGKNLNDFDMSNKIKKKSIISKILSMGPGRNATSSKGGTLANKVLSGNVMGLGDMGGAKYGAMIKAKKGTYVKASCKLGRNKATKIT